MAAGQESQSVRLEQEVRASREAGRIEESRFHYLAAVMGIAKVQQYRLQEEMRGYVACGGTGGVASGSVTAATGDTGNVNGSERRKSFR